MEIVEVPLLAVSQVTESPVSKSSDIPLHDDTCPKFIAIFIGGIGTSETEDDVLPILEKIANIQSFRLIKRPKKYITYVQMQ